MEKEYSELRDIIENYMFKNEIKGYRLRNHYRYITGLTTDSNGGFKCFEYCLKDPECKASSYTIKDIFENKNPTKEVFIYSILLFIVLCVL